MCGYEQKNQRYLSYRSPCWKTSASFPSKRPFWDRRSLPANSLRNPWVLRPTYWEGAPFSGLQLLPTDARPVTSWPDHYEAFHDMVQEISRVIKDQLISPKTTEDWLEEGIALYELKRYEEALTAYEQAVRLDPKNAAAYNNKGASLNGLQHREDALLAFEQAIRLDPNFVQASTNKDVTLINLLRK